MGYGRQYGLGFAARIHKLPAGVMDPRFNDPAIQAAMEQRSQKTTERLFPDSVTVKNRNESFSITENLPMLLAVGIPLAVILVMNSRG